MRTKIKKCFAWAEHESKSPRTTKVIHQGSFLRFISSMPYSSMFTQTNLFILCISESLLQRSQSISIYGDRDYFPTIARLLVLSKSSKETCVLLSLLLSLRIIPVTSRVYAFFINSFAPCLLHTPPLTALFVHSSMLHRLIGAPCLLHTPPLTA